VVRPWLSSLSKRPAPTPTPCQEGVLERFGMGSVLNFWRKPLIYTVCLFHRLCFGPSERFPPPLAEAAPPPPHRIVKKGPGCETAAGMGMGPGTAAFGFAAGKEYTPKDFTRMPCGGGELMG